MSLNGKAGDIYNALVYAGGEARLYQLAERVNTSPSYASRCLTRLVARGLVRRIAEGLYRVAEQGDDLKTLSTELSVPHKKAVTPVPVRPGRELSPPGAAPQRHPASVLLEVISRAPDPRKYAGVVQEIGKVLA